MIEKKTGLVRFLCLLLTLCLCLFAAGCRKTEPDRAGKDEPGPVAIGGRQVERDAVTLTAVISDGETALLDELPNLRRVDLSGSENVAEIAEWAASHPGVAVLYTVPLPDGTAVSSTTESLDLSSWPSAQAIEAASMLALLPELGSVWLGGENGPITWDAVAALRQSLPTAVFHYDFTLYGTEQNLADTVINLSHIPVLDGGAEVRRVMAFMPQLTLLDMDSCGVENWQMEEIRLQYPAVKVVWRVWFGDNYSVRTDVERILASQPSRGGNITTANYDGLFYCHDVRFLDIGHNDLLTDISFVAEMPKLEVAILSMCGWTDAGPLAECPNLEYLEMFTTLCGDLSPLSGLSNLRHLNVAGIGYDQNQWDAPIRLTDISPLYSLTQLERLWIGAFNPVPAEQIVQMQRCAPNCEINTSVYEDPSGGRWRYVELANYITTYVDTYHERYILLREQFGNYEASAFSFYWNDPLY